MTAKTAAIPTTAIICPINAVPPWEFAFDGSAVCAVAARINVDTKRKATERKIAFLISVADYWLF
jgi:hypothetical protein